MKLKETKPPKRLRKGHRRCTQVQCGFYRSGHCQSCEKGCNCSARPYEINESCQSCLDCEGKPGFLRFGDEKLEEEMKQHQKPLTELDAVVLGKPASRRVLIERELIK